MVNFCHVESVRIRKERTVQLGAADYKAFFIRRDQLEHFLSRVGGNTARE